MSALYELTTEQGRRYLLHPSGWIERTDMPFQPSVNWHVIAAVRLHGRGYAERWKFSAWRNWLRTGPQWLTKAGKPRYRLVDYDHGTVRQWGDGIRFVRELPQ